METWQIISLAVIGLIGLVSFGIEYRPKKRQLADITAPTYDAKAINSAISTLRPLLASKPELLESVAVEVAKNLYCGVSITPATTVLASSTATNTKSEIWCILEKLSAAIASAWPEEKP